MRNHPADVASRPTRFARLRPSAPPAAVSDPVQAGGGAARAVSRAWSAPLRAAAQVGGALLVVAAASWPLVFSSATFNNDWLNHLWYMWHQSLAVREDGVPSLFLNYSHGILYPLYAFYGGTLYALVGTLSLALGNAPLETYILTYLLGFSAAYGGWYWVSRMFGVRGWLAHVPGVVFITSASYLTMIYALGDWPEFLAVSMMPLMIAAGLSVLRAPRLRFGPALALTLSSVVFFGSHLITLIWGSTVLMIATLAILACAPGARRQVSRAGVLRVGALVIPALLVSAWFLLPTLAYESHTLIAHSYPHYRDSLRKTIYTVAAHNLFKLSHAPSTGTIVSLSLPILAVAWVLVSIGLLARGRRTGTEMRVLLVLAALTSLLGVAMTHPGLVLALPRMYSSLQYGFRLESFVLLGLSGAIVAALAIARDGRAGLRGWTWVLAPVAAVSVIGAFEQTLDHNSGRPRRKALASYLEPLPEKFGQFDYLDFRLRPREGADEAALPLVSFPLSTAAGAGSVSETVLVPPARLVATNIRGGPDLVEVRGARIASLDSELDDVLEVAPDTGPRGGASRPAARAYTATITVGPADRPPVLAGRLISLVALAVLLAQLGWVAARGIGRGARARLTR